MMSKAKWFAVRKPSTGEIIATSANQIVPPKFRGPTKMLYYIHQTPLSSCSVEGGSGDKTTGLLATIKEGLGVWVCAIPSQCCYTLFPRRLVWQLVM